MTSQKQPGPALSWPARYVSTGKRPAKLEEGSDLWIALEQLEHGPLTPDEVAELLDIDIPRARVRLHNWITSGYVRRCTDDEVPTRPRKPRYAGKRQYLTGKDSVLAMLTEHARVHGCFTISDGVRLTGKSKHAMNSVACSWVKRGLFVRSSPGTYVLADRCAQRSA